MLDNAYYSSGQKFPHTYNFLETLQNSISLVYIYSTTNALIIYIIHSFHTIISRRFLYIYLYQYTNDTKLYFNLTIQTIRN